MILVFTGNGKGKTTAALGQAMRALGHNKKVAIIQFLKGPWVSGEELFIQKYSSPSGELGKDLLFVKTGKGFVKILGDRFPLDEHKKAAQSGLEKARKIISAKGGSASGGKSNKYDLIILEEINVAVDLKLIKAKDVLEILKNIPKDMDVILTGRNAPKSFIQYADLVTEMKEIKHPFSKGSKAKEGLEY